MLQCSHRFTTAAICCKKGKDTRIGDILPPSAGNEANAGFAATSGTSAGSIPWDKVPWKDLARALDEAVKSVLKRRTQNKAKVEAIRDQVTPWIAEVYQGQKSS